MRYQLRLMAYALGLNPNNSLADEMPRLQQNDDLLQMTFRGDQPDVAYAVEWSIDLTIWQTAGVTITLPDPEGYRVASLATQTDATFLRLSVQLTAD